MEINMITQHMVTQIERARLPKLAEQGWLIEEAMAAQQPQPAGLIVRRWLGRILHPSGQHTLRAPQASAIEPHPQIQTASWSDRRAAGTPD